VNEQRAHPPEYLERQVWQLMKAGKLEQAAIACDQLNQAYPAYGSGWNTASRLAIALNEPVVALRAIQRALLLSPGKPEWVLQKMASLAVYGDLDAANLLADEIVDHKFATAYHASTCAVTLNRMRRYADAEKHFLRAVELNPNNPNYRFSLASAQRYLGKDEAAAQSLDKAIELNPLDYEAQLIRSGFRTQTASHNNIDSLLAARDRLGDDHPGAAQLHYALAKEYDDIGRFDDAFGHLQRGAVRRRKELRYVADSDLQTMRLLQEEFDKELFRQEREGFISAEPIFVIGMPRSGTALVENILINHPVVRTVGDSQNFGIELVNQCEKSRGAVPANAGELVTAARKIDFAALGEAYITQARPTGGDIAHFVDRQPINFLYAGLIHLALPKAKIILVERDPVETCFTVFRTFFPAAYPYSYDLEELGNYYVGYHRLIKHWQEVLPGVMHSIQYEDIVQDARPAIENLLEYCDLSFDKACLNFNSASPNAEDLSPVQLRQQLRERSLGHWRNYRTQLQSLLDILEAAGIQISDE
jgi:tetratricopeptide (TPR) repeat protein